jgi:hypothetical protein
MNGTIPDPYDDPSEPPNKLIKGRLDELNEHTASTVRAWSTGGSVFMLTARDDHFWGNTYQTINDLGYQVQKHLEGTLFIERAPNERDLERRAEAEKERVRTEEPMRSEDVDEWVAVDDLGAVVAGPFETDEDAWTALDGTPAEGTDFAEPAGWHDDDAPRSLGDEP